LLGSTLAGTLALIDDVIGLRFTISLPDTSTGRDVLALAQRGDLASAIRLRARPRAMSWEKGKDGVAVSIVKRVKALREISIVALPPYAAAGITSMTAAPTPPDTRAPQRAREAMAAMRQAVAAG